MIILAIDLGKFNSVSCRFDDETQETSYERFETSRRVPLLACPAVSGSNVALPGKPAVAPARRCVVRRRSI